MSKNEAVKDFFGDIKQHLMTGISYMIPVIIVFALFMVLSQIPGATQELMTDLNLASAATGRRQGNVYAAK